MAATPPALPLSGEESESAPPDKGDTGGCSPPSGLIQLFTGDGKGKTSAALGTMLRAAAVGMRVAVVCFDKGGESHYSERSLIRGRLADIELFVTGRDRIDPATGAFDFGVTDEDRREGERALGIVRRLFAESKHDLIILDEINSSTALGMVHEQDVLALLGQKPDTMELIMTGRNAPPSFIEKADLVTEMRNVKHYFDTGVPARRGFDY